MKVLLSLVMIFISYMTIDYIQEIRKLEDLIFDLYKGGFEEYILINNNLEIDYNREKLQKHIENLGYFVEWKEGVLSFTIGFRKIYCFEKFFEFNLVKNNELE